MSAESPALVPALPAPVASADAPVVEVPAQVPRTLAVEMWAPLGVLAALVLLNIPMLGATPWPFRPGPVDATGVLAPLVRLADGRWEVGLLRAIAMLGAVLIAGYGCVVLLRRSSDLRPLIGVSALVVALLVLPSVLLQMALRDSTAPWFFTNDSTYQIELAGDLAADGRNPYGHDYSSSGLERFYGLDGTPGKRAGAHVATEHFAYFPGTVIAASGWRLLPRPWDDYRLLVALATVGLFFAALAFAAPLPWKLAVGAVLAANPLIVRGAWFGTADAPALLCLVLAFALLSRSRYMGAAVMLAGAVLLKQFALVAVPFFLVMLLLSAPRPAALRAVGTFAAVTAAGLLPFIAAGPSDFWADTVTYGTDTYRIVGYGLAGLLVGLGVLSRTGEYPFALLALVVWLPVTLLLLRAQLRSNARWLGAVGFALSVFLLIFIGRVFHGSYLLWPLAGAAAATLLAVAHEAPDASVAGPALRRISVLRPRIAALKPAADAARSTRA